MLICLKTFSKLIFSSETFFQCNRTPTKLYLFFVIWFRYSSDPPVTGHSALELGPSELTFSYDSLTVQNE
jgi:hypothetical protein